MSLLQSDLEPLPLPDVVQPLGQDKQEIAARLSVRTKSLRYSPTGQSRTTLSSQNLPGGTSVGQEGMCGDMVSRNVGNGHTTAAWLTCAGSWAYTSARTAGWCGGRGHLCFISDTGTKRRKRAAQRASYSRHTSFLSERTPVKVVGAARPDWQGRQDLRRLRSGA